MLNQKDMHELRKAYNTLENPGFRIKAMGNRYLQVFRRHGGLCDGKH